MFIFAHPNFNCKRMNIFSKISILVLISVFVLSCGQNNVKQELTVFHAGSLSVPFKKIAREFEKENPNVKVLLEADGSRKCARKITDLNKKCDVMASADYTVINNLLIPKHAKWNIKFASNEMTIVYHNASKYANKINADNWHEILLKDDVSYGRSEPNSDPCGYRAVLTCKLAEKFYKKDGFAKEILAKNKNFIRPKETDLLSLLETNTIDYIFLYRSVAQQHGLKYVLLPDSINLKLSNLENYYSTAETKISGKKPGEFITKKGAPMVYGMTIPTNAANHKLAEKFVEFILEKDKGMKIIEDNGQASMVPSFSKTYNRIPNALKIFAKTN